MSPLRPRRDIASGGAGHSTSGITPMNASCSSPSAWRRPVSGVCLVLMVFTLLAVAGALPARADDALAGTYAVQGWDPNEAEAKDKPYSGTATLTKQGEAFAYAGDLDGYKYSGVAIYHPETKTLALHFKEEKTGKVGVAHFRVAGAQLDGTWAWMGDPKGRLGKEVWIRK